MLELYNCKRTKVGFRENQLPKISCFFFVVFFPEANTLIH
jgi:hypothetical protein